MYRERMINYYPPVLQSVSELQAIVDSESSEISQVNEGIKSVISDAYLLTMSEERISQWENQLGIRAVEGSTVEDRRETIIARVRGQGKLNTATLNSIVKTFNGAGCETFIEDGVLHIRLLHSSNKSAYLIENVTQEISNKIPAHLGLLVERSFQPWKNVNEDYTDWQAVRYRYGTWERVLYDSDKENSLNESKLDSFKLA